MNPLYEMTRVGKSRETKSRLVVAGELRGDEDKVTANEDRVSLEEIKMF